MALQIEYVASGGVHGERKHWADLGTVVLARALLMPRGQAQLSKGCAVGSELVGGNLRRREALFFCSLRMSWTAPKTPRFER